MRPLWKGAISFGLVNIPVGLYSATGQSPTVDLDLLRDSDHSKIRYKKVAEADGKEVPNEHIVKGFEFEKGSYVVVTKEDFDRVTVKSSQTVDIREFVKVSEIDQRYFDKAYYLAPDKQGMKAYALLHAALKETGLAGLAKVVIRPPREHLALLTPLDNVLMLATMHFADELRNTSELQVQKVDVGEKELKMALSLVETMSGEWEPEKYKDEYRQGLLDVIEQKVQAGPGKLPVLAKPKQGSQNVIDLVELLQQSLGNVEKTGKKSKAFTKPQKTAHKKAA